MAVQTLTLMPIWELCKKPAIVAAVIVAGLISGTFDPHLASGSGPDAPTCGRLTTAGTVISRQLLPSFWI